MMFWDVVIAGLIMVFWIIVREVFIHLLIPSIFVQTILIVLVILKCTFYVTNLLTILFIFEVQYWIHDSIRLNNPDMRSG